MHFYYCFGQNFNIQLKKVCASQNFMVLYTVLISSSLIYIYVNSYFIITSSVVSGYEYLTVTWETQVRSPLKPRPFFTFFFFFLDLAKFSQKNGKPSYHLLWKITYTLILYYHLHLKICNNWKIENHLHCHFISI